MKKAVGTVHQKANSSKPIWKKNDRVMALLPGGLLVFSNISIP